RHMQTVESRKVARLLPAVTGNDAESLTNTGWNRSVSRSENTRRGAQFIKGNGRYSLMLFAEPLDKKSAPEIVAQPPIRVTSPIQQLERGEIAYVTGRVRLPSTVVGSVNGAMVFDSISGVAGAIRWREQTNGWVQFDLLREAKSDGPFYLTFLLGGFGQLQVADLEVVVYPPLTSGPTLTGFSQPTR
ncbi:MAG: hypothetical protein AB8G99_15025, partial [Planctomycetaceae bacterium]